MAGNCTPLTLEQREEFSLNSLNSLRRMFNGERVKIEGKEFKLKDSITKHYGDVSEPLGKKMFEEIVWRGTYKPAIDSYTGFNVGDVRRIRNEILKESKNLNNTKLSYLEKYGFVTRGVMQKTAVTNYMNKGINFIANYENNAFSTYMYDHVQISKLIRTETLARNGRSALIPGIKEVKDLEKLENRLLLEINNPSSNVNESEKTIREITRILESDGGSVLREITEYLETPADKNGKRTRLDEEGKQVKFSKNVEEAGQISRNLLNNMGKVLISGLRKHIDVIRNGYLNSKDNLALLTKTGRMVERYEKTINEEIKAIKKGIEDGNYFPHFLVESFLNIENIMEKADKDGYREPESDLPKLEQIVTEMRSSLGSPKSAKFRKTTAYNSYLKNPISVLRKYSLDAIAFNKANHLKSLYFEGMRGMPKGVEGAEPLEKYVSDVFQLAEKGYSERPSWVNKTVRTLTGMQFLSKLGFGIGTATRNTLSGMYYIQSVGNRNFAKYLRDFENSPYRDAVITAEKEQGFRFEDMSSPLYTEGLLPTEGIKTREIEIKEINGNHVLQYKEGNAWRTFDSALSSAAGTGAVLQRVTENFLRKHMFRYTFIDKYKELKRNGVSENKASIMSSKHAVDMVGKYAFEYSASQKAPVVGGTPSNLGAAGQVAFQFMHYPMSFAQLQSNIIRKSVDAVKARQWDNPDVVVPMRFAGLYLFTEMMSGIFNLDFQRIMENDTVERIVLLKDALEGKDVKGRGFLGPTVGELYYYATLNDFVKTPDNVVADIVVGYNDAYGMTKDQKQAKLLSSINVQFSKIVTKDYKALTNGNGWDVMMHEFGLYPTKETRELRGREPFKTLFPQKKSQSKEKTPQQLIAEKKQAHQEELTKLYRSMGI